MDERIRARVRKALRQREGKKGMKGAEEYAVCIYITKKQCIMIGKELPQRIARKESTGRKGEEWECSLLNSRSWIARAL